MRLFSITNAHTGQLLDTASSPSEAHQLQIEYEDDGIACTVSEAGEEPVVCPDEAHDGDLVSFLLSTLAGVY